MEHEVIEAKGSAMGDTWHVEAIDYDSEGECYVTVFHGLRAKERAEEYAEFKNQPAATRGLWATSGGAWSNGPNRG